MSVLCYNYLMDNQYKNKNNHANLEKINNFEMPPESLESLELKEKKDKFEKNFPSREEKHKNKMLSEKNENATTIHTGINKNQSISEESILTKAVEEILSEGLNDLFQDLDQSQKTIFKQKGEQTAVTIAVMISSVKYKISEILELIRNWLFIIPSINKFFLEQESKIKTDKILLLDTKNKNLKV